MNVRDTPATAAATGAATQYAGATAVLKPYDGPVETVPPKEVFCSPEIVGQAIARAAGDATQLLELKSIIKWLRERKISVAQRQGMLVINISSLRQLAPDVYEFISLRARIYTVATHTTVMPGKRVPVPKFYGYAWAVLGSAEDLMKGEVARAALNISSGIAIGTISMAIAEATVGAAIASAPVVLGTLTAASGAIVIVGVAILISAGLMWALDESGLLQKLEDEIKAAGRDLNRAGDQIRGDVQRLLRHPQYTPTLFGAPVR